VADIVIINPRFEISFWGLEHCIPLFGKRANLPVAINVLANDTDPNGDPLTLIAVSDPTHGTAVINTNGTPTNPTDDTITYTPDPGYSGVDQFSYTVSDGTNQATASVAVNVAPPPGNTPARCCRHRATCRSLRCAPR